MPDGKAGRRFSWLWLAILVVALLLVAGFAAVTWSIQSGIHNASELALREHPGDRVEALMAFVESDEHSWSERNRAVWALGQLRDPRALPVLERYYTGEPCDHARMLCQHELSKAIALLRPKQAR